ncbi:sn1-specific diacylglycerol lipase beta-like [Papaver somniferum]|uniref:sn1-specific diacylglycerol lipase beta-like n=1 Tax=Papaver somniferum TaxID=3469 RepID=UPI000E6FAD7D|nr:sn1-specific diacylglycerol lipase beta-like [Papaver somniferum]
MVKQSIRSFLLHIEYNANLQKKQEPYRVYSLLTQSRSQCSKADKPQCNGSKEAKDASQKGQSSHSSNLSRRGSDHDDLDENKWKLELAWLSKALEPALQLCRWALPTGSDNGQNPPPSSRSLTEILASIQKSKIGIQDWSLSDLTMGLYLTYLRQASAARVEDVKGIQISSNSIVQDLIYHTELAKGAYKENAAGLARNSMLRERNVLKFVNSSSVMRPGYYIGIDIRNKLVILGIRGTHTVYDFITDVISSSEKEVTFEGFSSHFGTAEAARWFLCHEIATLRKCLEKHEGFRLRLVGHSLGGAAASLLAIMLRKKSQEELGFSPDIVTAIGVGTPPCLSKELAESCASYVSTLVLQDDIVPRLSVASLQRLREEILQTDWRKILEKEDWKSVVDMIANAKQVVSSVQDVARKLADYASFGSKTDSSDGPVRKELLPVRAKETSPGDDSTSVVKAGSVDMPEELFIPGTLYFLKRDLDDGKQSRYSTDSKARESYTLWQRNPGEHFQNILLSGNLISDHKCDNHYYALRDVLKCLARPDNEQGIYG